MDVISGTAFFYAICLQGVVIKILRKRENFARYDLIIVREWSSPLN